MHIALCDDNVADRKQFERLVKRESDRRAATDGTLFVDSFGNADSLLTNPMQYDVFYIDRCKTPNITGADVVKSLKDKGVNAPIVMCCSNINYREQDFPENVIFLDKPIKADELSASIDHALKIMEQAVPLIEIRVEKETRYMTESDIMYAVERGRMLDIFLQDGSMISILDNAQNLFSQLEGFPVFFSPGMKVVLNGRYIEQIGFYKVTMRGGRTFHVSHGCMAYAKKMFNEFHPC